MDHVLTLIAGANPLDPTRILEIEVTLRGAGADVGPADWLAPLAVDLPFAGIAPMLARDLAYEALEDAAVDAVAQPQADRRKRLLVADMESTVIENEMLDELADECGIRAEIAAITERAMRGELDFEAALRERVAMLTNLDAAALDRAKARTRITAGARALVATMRANGGFCFLVSGGFTFFTDHIRDRLGFDRDQANRLGIADGKLTGTVLDPILGRDAKREALLAAAAERNVPLAETMAVGDGANDLDMLAAAGLGVAFHAKPVVAQAARARIDHADLTALLYLQGYREEEIRR